MSLVTSMATSWNIKILFISASSSLYETIAGVWTDIYWMEAVLERLGLYQMGNSRWLEMVDDVNYSGTVKVDC